MSVAAVEARATRPPSGRAHVAPRPIAGVLVLSSLGVLVTAAGYAAGRAGTPYGMVAFWFGQALVLTPVLLRVLAGRLSEITAFVLAIGLAVNDYALKWTYSPDQLRFGDELQHWAATGTLLRTGRLFQPNDALPAAVHYPGLAEMGAAVTRLTGLSVTTSAFIVAGVLHLILVGAIFMLVRRCGGGPTLAALTCVVYATGLHYLFFDSMYAYQTAALPFLVLAIWAVRRRDPIVAVIAILIVTVSHHVTGLVLMFALAGLAILDRRRSTAIAAITTVACVGGWMAFVAPEVFGYLWQPFGSVFRAGSGGSAGGSAPWILAIQAVGILGLLVVLAVALRVVHRHRPRDPWQIATLFGAGLYFAGLALRVVGASGPELAARAATFTYLPLAAVTATVLLRWRAHRPSARRPLIVGALLVVLLATGARLGGWPPSWALLPGPYVAAGQERSVEPLGIDAATWTRTSLGPGHRIAADLTGWTLTSTYGRQDPVGTVASLYDDPMWTSRNSSLVRDLAIRYVWVDTR
ncbi:MAG TPA: hypothetical protein VGF84_18090, partial [Micromonosporaceae bacterium]